MKAWAGRVAILVLPLLGSAASRGAPADFDLGGYDKPSVLQGVNQPRECTVTYLIEDFVANETFAARMQFGSAPDAVPMNGRMRCPALVPRPVAVTALNGCRAHAGKTTDCVFADMGRGFHDTPAIANTSENASRCASDQASQIAIACWNSGGSDVCNVGCGGDRDAAVAAARSRCEATHQKACTITGVVPVQGP
ncbi:MAG TPA: hypothetical protein VGL95_18660 [Acetobacteraceae bacterium]|jgi:hypothetical protein